MQFIEYSAIQPEGNWCCHTAFLVAAQTQEILKYVEWSSQTTDPSTSPDVCWEMREDGEKRRGGGGGGCSERKLREAGGSKRVQQIRMKEKVVLPNSLWLIKARGKDAAERLQLETREETDEIRRWNYGLSTGSQSKNNSFRGKWVS